MFRKCAYLSNIILGIGCAFLSIVPLCALCAERDTSCKTLQLSKKIINLDCTTANPKHQETQLSTFLTKHGQNFTGGSKNLGLILHDTRQSLRGSFKHYQQIADGFPIHQAILTVHQNTAGQIQRVYGHNIQSHTQSSSAKTNQPKPAFAITAAISQQQAEQIALLSLKNLVATPQLRLIKPATQTWHSVADGELRLVWQVAVFGDNPLGDFRLMVDATNGSILSKQNRLTFFQDGQGWVFQANPVQSSGNTSLVDNNNLIQRSLTLQLNKVILHGLAESAGGLLVGQFVDLATLNSPYLPQSTYLDARQTNRNYFYNRNDPRFEQVMVYHTLDSYQRYLRALGFNNTNAVPNGILRKPIRANAHWDNKDMSMYVPSDGTIRYGDGGVNDAEDADIILHEFGHAIQNAQNPDWGCSNIIQNCEMAAMGEGFSDYIAADFHAKQGNAAYQRQHAACIGEWDGTAYSKTKPSCLRRVDSNKIYPRDIGNSIYDNSAIWSRALWDIRNALGSNLANQLILEHHYGLPADATMPIAALEIVSVDKELFAGLHEQALRKVFCARGILANSQCQISQHPKTIVYANKDSFISKAFRNNNYGGRTSLHISGMGESATHTVVGFTVANSKISQLQSAVLELSITNSDQQWGEFGRTIDIHPLKQDFTEGRGGGTLSANATRGVTWNCPTDLQITNNRADCSLAWSGGLGTQKNFGQGSSVPVVQTNGMAGKVRWTVTDDLKAGVQRWLIKKTFSEPGKVEYYSKEGAQKLHNPALAPRLIITYQ